MLSLLHKVLHHEKKRPQLLLHVGAGLCKELHDYLALGFDSIHLVEANAEHALQLREKAQLANKGGRSIVTVHEKVIAKESGPVDFYRTNNVFYDALVNPSVLKGLYPNLSILNIEARSAESLSSLIRSIGPKSEVSNVLVLDAWASADWILGGSLDEFYADFELILLRGVSEEEASKYVEVLSGRCFDFIMSDDDDVHDRWVVFKKNKLAGDFDELFVKFQTLEQVKTELENKCLELQNEALELKQCRELVHGEIQRVESQIELIKDVVLREKAF